VATTVKQPVAGRSLAGGATVSQPSASVTLEAAPGRDHTWLQRAFLRGVASTGAVRWSAQAATWAITLFVARLLRPEDYGIVAMATVIHGLVTILSEFGVGVTIVTLRQLSSAQIAQFNGLSALLGATACVAMAAFAPAIAAFFERSALIAVVMVMGATFLVSGLRTIPAALLQRDLRFGTLALIEATQAMIGAATVLTCAWHGWGYWAIVSGALAASVSWSTLLLIVRPCAFAWPRRRDLGSALTFTGHQVTGSIAWYVYSNADFVVAGRWLGAHDLGIYSMAWTLARVVPERIANIALRLTPAFFAAVSDEVTALRRWLAGVTEGIAIVCFPLLVGLSLVAGDALRVIAGPQWDAAALPLRLLALYGAFDVVTQPLTRALVAVGDARFTARIGIALALIMPFGFIAGAHYGPVGLAIAWLLLAPTVRILALLRVRHLIGLRVTEYLAALRPAVVATIVMALAVIVASQTFNIGSPLARLAVGVAVGAAAYAGTLIGPFKSRSAFWLSQYRRLRHA
jgi:O-antigen/teichoic acid export membrane protein